MLEIENLEYTDTTRLKLFGEVEIENGDTKIKGRNHWVGTGFETLAAFIGTGSGTTINVSTSNWYILLGTDTETPTNVAMSTLVNLIPTWPNFKLTSGNYYSGSTNAVSVAYTAVWFPGTVSGNVGEMGLYLTLNGGVYPGGNPGMVARLSVADGSLNVFTVNTNNPLNIVWYVNLVYM